MGNSIMRELGSKIFHIVNLVRLVLMALLIGKVLMMMIIFVFIVIQTV